MSSVPPFRAGSHQELIFRGATPTDTSEPIVMFVERHPDHTSAAVWWDDLGRVGLEIEKLSLLFWKTPMVTIYWGETVVGQGLFTIDRPRPDAADVVDMFGRAL